MFNILYTTTKMEDFLYFTKKMQKKGEIQYVCTV